MLNRFFALRARTSGASEILRPGFTLIELLIVVAIIAILAAIAVPNFLEAQTRAKISRVRADMRSVDTAMQAYIVDYNDEPKVLNPNALPSGAYSDWWGFVSDLLTTPVSFITSLPTHPFSDETVVGAWVLLDPAHNSQENQAYTVIRDTSTAAGWPAGVIVTNLPAQFGTVTVDPIFAEAVESAGYVLYSCGPDNLDAAVYGAPTTYDPTNGTTSFGDLYRYGAGSPNDDNRLN
jgi:general secretion pathway protein G